MDIPRVSEARKRRIRRIIYGILALIAIAVITVALSRLKPAAPTVERATVWVDTVKRGPMVRQVRGLGTLVPEEIRWIPAVTDGRVERILVHPGTSVTADTVILELSNPEQEQAAVEARAQLQSAEAELANLEAQLKNELLQQQSAAAAVTANYQLAKLQAEADTELARQGLQSALITKQSQMKADTLLMQNEIETKRLAQTANSQAARLRAKETDVARLRAFVRLRENQLASLKVRAGTDGMLQQVPVEVGSRVGPGTNLARVANPLKLKAELKVAETQAKDIQIGQRVSIDTRNGLIDAHVSRVDPAVQQGTVTVDAALDSELPRGARPDLSVDGTIELERLDDVLFVGRPAYGQEESQVTLFRLEADGSHATRAKVVLGRTSVNTVEIKGGLKIGDQVILSDMSTWDAFDRVRLR
jgi:HlyD family secretion protein